jgi:cytochrome P450
MAYLILGPIYTLWVGRQPTIVISSAQVAVDLLEKRSNIYSSRPRFVVMGEMYLGNDSTLVMPYGEKWRKHRKLLHSGLMQKAAHSYRPVQELESKRLTWDLVNRSEQFAEAIDRYTASITLMLAFGRRVDSLGDPLVNRVVERNRFMANLNVYIPYFVLVNLRPGGYLAESFPILKYVPSWLAPWKGEVLRMGDNGFRLFWDQCRVVRAKMLKGTAMPCFSAHIWDVRDEYNLTDREVAFNTGSLFGAGSDTSSASLQTFLLAMTAFGKDILPKAWEEIDRVVGSERAPTWSDEPNLPYIRAIVKETLRWRPVAVLGGQPHASIKDDYYKGYYIPKGATMLGNLWAIHLNPEDYPDPNRFRPERFLDGSLRNYPQAQGHSSFGWGRRVCPGQLVAEQSLFISVSRILWGFKISPPLHPNTGKELPVDINAYTDGFNSKPLPFQCHVQPRGEKYVQVMKREYEDAVEALQKYEPTDPDSMIA